MKSFFTDAEKERRLAGACQFNDSPLYIYGAGRVGEDLLRKFNYLNIKADGFIDDNPKFLNTRIMGKSVISLADLQARTLDAQIIVAAPAIAAKIMREATEKAGFRHVFSMSEVMMGEAGKKELELLDKNEDAINALSVWEDEKSRDCYRSLVRYRITYEDADLPAPLEGQYFNRKSGCTARNFRSFVDCGAFDGDTMRAFLEITNGDFDHYYAFEPVPSLFSQLKDSACGDERIKLYNVGVGNKSGNLRFLEADNGASRFSEKGNIVVPVECLDQLLMDLPVTMIKMDLEGYEPFALEGAKKIILQHRPALAVCVYHETEHLWSIPLWIKKLEPAYRLRLLHHRPDQSETVCYAVCD